MKKISMILLVFFLMVLQLGCTSEDVEQKHVKISPDYAVANNISEMVKNAETIVIGTFQEYKHSYNAERNPRNDQEESKDTYSEAKVYAFRIEKQLKGNVSEPSIQVSIPHTKEVTGLRDEQGNELRVRIPSVGHVQPQLGKKYVLFLTKDEKSNLYLAPFTPYMIEIKSDNKVVLQKPPEKAESSLRTKRSHYHIDVEGVHLKQDEISGKDLDSLIDEMEKEIES